MEEFTTYQSFYTQEEAEAFAEVLKEENILFKIETDKAILDKQFIGEDLDKKVHLKIRQEDFNRADEAFNKIAERSISEISSDHYLFSFSNDELSEIIQKPDEWSRQDFFLAKKLLADRGVNISAEKISQLKNERTKELAKPESGVNAWIFFCYLLILFCLYNTLIRGYYISSTFGLVSLFLGYILRTSKKVLPDGTKVLMFDKLTRTHGIVLFILGLILVLVFIYQILPFRTY